MTTSNFIGIVLCVIIVAFFIFALVRIIRSTKTIRDNNQKIKTIDNDLKELERQREMLYNNPLWDTLISDIENIVYVETDVKEGVLKFDYMGRYFVYVAPIDINHEKPYAFMYAVDEVKENSVGECALSSFNKEKSFALAEMLLDRDGMREELKTIIEENGIQ